MLIRTPRRWQRAGRDVTPEAAFFTRRRLLKAGAGAGAAVLAGAAGAAGPASAGFLNGLFGAAPPPPDSSPDPTAGLYPARRDEAFAAGRPLTPESASSTYNNFYEYGPSKDISEQAQALKIRPWSVEIGGMVEKPRTVDIDTLIRAMPLEERIYRHRCVEAWGMTVPWTGFALKALVEQARPLSSATYVRFETFLDPAMAPGQNAPFYPWPYVEGLTMAEATNELAFLATGVYGKPLARQFGAPLRLAVPWKYGFKSIKSIRRITFTDQRPVTFWEGLQASEYGFWANVNPAVPHPRWSQASEELIGTGGEHVPTQLFNGYAEEVAGLYRGLEGEKLYM